MNTIICLIFITLIICTLFYFQNGNLLGNSLNFKTLISFKPKKKSTINDIMFELLNLWVNNIKTILSKLYPF